jgi:adenylate kinase family enzyme
VRRVVILGRGGAGKSVLARQLSSLTGIPAIELDSVFWQQDAVPASAEEWLAWQRDLVAGETWILDGDLGPYDSGLYARLAAADTIIVLDFGFVRCAWRTLRRGREQAEYWRWVWSYRRRSMPRLRIAIVAQLPRAQVHVLRNPAKVRRFLADVRGELAGQGNAVDLAGD